MPSTVFATHHDGRPLTVEHGFPVRLVVPGRYAWKGPKWVRAVEYMRADRRGFWGYLLGYQALTSTAALRGYAQQIAGSTRRWR